MNKGTIVRTIARIAFSVYSALCVWQVAIGELSEQLKAPWLVALCAAAIVVAGLITDICTTWYNNDYTPESDTGTKIARQMKKLKTFAPEYVEEPEDASIEEGGEIDG